MIGTVIILIKLSVCLKLFYNWFGNQNQSILYELQNHLGGPIRNSCNQTAWWSFVKIVWWRRKKLLQRHINHHPPLIRHLLGVPCKITLPCAYQRGRQMKFCTHLPKQNKKSYTMKLRTCKLTFKFQWQAAFIFVHWL